MSELQVCLSDRPGQLLRWQEAFPHGRILSAKDDVCRWLDAGAIIWLHLDVLDPGQLPALCGQLLSRQPQGRLVGMSSTPGPDQALDCLRKGMVGFCHALSAPAHFCKVARVVETGGYWLGETLVQRLVGSLERNLQPGQSNGHGDPLDKLSRREQQVALQVRNGAANKEIARTLDITERTVKAHLGAIFQKLEVRDRLQLVLLLQKSVR